MKRSEILKNRQTWINRLKDPNSKKATNRLTDGNGFCCLGHGCDVLLSDVEWTKQNQLFYDDEYHVDLPPTDFVTMVGLWNDIGSTDNNQNLNCYPTDPTDNLVHLNDDSTLTPQKIGEYLESVIEGGIGTPFKPLSMYKE